MNKLFLAVVLLASVTAQAKFIEGTNVQEEGNYRCTDYSNNDVFDLSIPAERSGKPASLSIKGKVIRSFVPKDVLITVTERVNSKLVFGFHVRGKNEGALCSKIN